jgi:hypothetical protein
MALAQPTQLLAADDALSRLWLHDHGIVVADGVNCVHVTAARRVVVTLHEETPFPVVHPGESMCGGPLRTARYLPPQRRLASCNSKDGSRGPTSIRNGGYSRVMNAA